MKFNFLKFKKDNLPSLESLKSEVFNVDKFWFMTLVLCFVILLITAMVGFKLFCFLYFESYKNSAPEDFGNMINVERLKSSIEKRKNFVNEQITLPRDPSI